MPRTILAVDDSNVALHKYRLLLPRYTVIPASSGVEALGILDRQPDVDLILLDLNMPRMNGFEFLQALRKEPRYARIPVLVVSGEGREQELSRALALGAKACLIKPFPPRDLPRLVAATVRLPARQAKPSPPKLLPESLTQPASGRRRIACGQPCDLVATDNVWHGLVWNVSVGGVYVVLAVPFRVGDSVRLKFALPGDPHAIDCDGRVAWVNPPAKGSGALAPHLPVGCGLEFGRINPVDRTRIDALVRARAEAR